MSVLLPRKSRKGETAAHDAWRFSAVNVEGNVFCIIDDGCCVDPSVATLEKSSIEQSGGDEARVRLRPAGAKESMVVLIFMHTRETR